MNLKEKSPHQISGCGDQHSSCSCEGEDLLETVVGLTGLPREMITEELESILQKAGRSTENLTLDDLRFAMMSYLNALDTDLVPPGDQIHH